MLKLNSSSSSASKELVEVEYAIEMYDLSTSWKESIVNLVTGHFETESPRTSLPIELNHRGGETGRTELSNGVSEIHDFSASAVT